MFISRGKLRSTVVYNITMYKVWSVVIYFYDNLLKRGKSFLMKVARENKLGVPFRDFLLE